MYVSMRSLTQRTGKWSQELRPPVSRVFSRRCCLAQRHHASIALSRCCRVLRADTSDDAPLSICVNADAPDRALGQLVRDMLFELGVDAALAPEPAPDQPPAQWRQDYESMLDESHGVVIIYGATAPSWVQAQVRAARKLLARTRRGTWGALLDGPPGQQPDHGVRSHSLVMLDCRGGVAPEPLSQFLTLLRGSGSAPDSAHV